MIRLLLVELEPDDPETRALARALRDSGVEVVYSSATTAEEIAHAAVQEDVRAVGLVIHTDDHRRVAAELAAKTVVFATANVDEQELRESGVKAVFRRPSVDHIVDWAGKLA
jgi:methylmalonyl-CoA mutase C-terminal domain/subunit